MEASELVCPVCGFPGLTQPPYAEWPGLPLRAGSHPPYQYQFGAPSFEICPSCGFEFGFEDHAAASGSETSFTDYRQQWERGGCRWWGQAHRRPPDWDGRDQLAAAGLGPPTASSPPKGHDLPLQPALSLVVIRVADLEASRLFYGQLGFAFVPERHGNGPAHLSADTGELVIELYPRDEAHSTDGLRLGFRVADLDTVAASCAASVLSELDRDGHRVVVIMDPDGHKIELTQR